VTELSDLEKEFVQASVEAVDRVQREKEAGLRREAQENKATATRFRRLLFATAVFAVIAIGASSWGWWQSEQKNASESLSRERVLQAMKLQPLNYVDDQLDLALLLGIEANRSKEVQPELRRALLTALESNLELQSLVPGHTGGVRAVAFSPAAKILASGSFDSTIILWDERSGQMLLPPLRGHTDHVYRVAFSPDGTILASASGDHTVRLWEVKTGELKGKPLSHNGEVYSVAIEKSGKILASGGKDGTVRLWNIESLELETVLVHNKAEAGKPAGEVYNVAFSPDGNIVASGGADGRIILWDMKRRQQAGEPLKVHRPVFSMAFSHNGTTIASGNSEGRVDLWDVRARKWVTNPSPNHFRAVYGLAFSPDDTQLATVSTDRTAYIRDLKNLKAKPQRLKGYAEQFLSVDFTKEGKVVTGTVNATIVLWDLYEHKRLGSPLTWPKGKGSWRGEAFFGRTNAIVSFSSDQLLFWDLGAKGMQGEPIPADAQGSIKYIVLSPDRNFLVTIGTDNSVKLWDVSKRLPIKTLVEPGKALIFIAAFNVDNQTLAIGGENEIRLLSLPDGTLKKTLPSEGKINALAFSPNGKMLASAQLGYYGITIWDLATSQAAIKRSDNLEDARLNHESVNSLVFSANGEILVSGGRDSVGFWDSRTGQPLGRRLAYHPGVVTSLAVSADGKLLASGSSDNTVLLWDLDMRQPLSQPIRGHQAPVLSVDFSPDGRWLASASSKEDEIIRWEVNTDTWFSKACSVVGRNFTEGEWKQFFGDQEFRITCPKVRANEADALALKGDRAEAEKFFREALDAVLQTKDYEGNNHVCMMGSISRFAKLVKPACEKAVELAPDIPTKRLIQDSRGLARALTGDTAGAIEDFTTALESIKAGPFLFDAAFLQRRENWIAALKEGRDPFDDAMLKLLRTE
jgi:WD40 repeat protein